MRSVESNRRHNRALITISYLLANGLEWGRSVILFGYCVESMPSPARPTWHLSAGWAEILPPLTVRLVTIGLLLVALIFGSRRQFFSMDSVSIWGTQVSADTQLTFIGIINKAMDYLVAYNLEYMASLILTLQMTQKQGVYAMDYEMKEALIKPWAAVVHYLDRCRLFGWKSLKWTTHVRFILVLACSICFLLLSAALNTIGIPKQRWWPDEFPKSKANEALMTCHTAQMSLIGIGWKKFQELGSKAVGNGPQSWIYGIASASMSTYSMLATLEDHFKEYPKPGWHAISGLGSNVTVLNTNVSNAAIETMSIKTSLIEDVYNKLHKAGPAYARSSSGLMGRVGLTLPQLTTSCSSISSSMSLGHDAIKIVGPDLSVQRNALKFYMGPNMAMNFSGAECNLALCQIIYPVSFYYNSPTEPGVNLVDVDSTQDMWGYKSIPPKVLPSTSYDLNNLQALGSQFMSIVPLLDGLLTGSSLVQHMVLAARKLGATQPHLINETASLPLVVAVMMQHLISLAAWNMTSSSTEIVTHFPLRWIVYGSGPRIAWEWTIVISPCFLLLFLTYGLYLTLRHHIQPGPWLKVGGMMAASNTTARMKSTEGSIAGVATWGGRKSKYFMRENGTREIKLVDDDILNASPEWELKVLNKRTVYSDVEEEIPPTTRLAKA